MRRVVVTTKSLAASALVGVVGCCPHKHCEGSGSSPTKAFVGANVLICLIFQKFPLPRAIRMEYEHPSSVRDYLSGHVLHRIQCKNISPNHVFLIVNISVIYLL